MSRVVFGLDQAVHSGWGIGRERGPLVRHGLAKTHRDRLAALDAALELAGGPQNLFVLFEQHDHMPVTRLTRFDRHTQRQGRSGAPERSNATLIGMGKSYGRWLELLDLRGVPESLRDEVQPRSWRAACGVRGQGTDQLKQAAIDWALRELGEVVVDHNEAEGMAITWFAAWHGLALRDAKVVHKRAAARDKRAAAKQQTMFAEPANDNAVRAAERKVPW